MRSSRRVDASFVEENLLSPGGGTVGSDFESGSSTFGISSALQPDGLENSRVVNASLIEEDSFGGAIDSSFNLGSLELEISEAVHSEGI